eukprot:2961168-Pleurochrysis_carterae.AAC.4
MHHAVLVHMVDAHTDLGEEAPDLRLGERGALLARLPQQPPQVAVLRPLEHNVELVVLDERVNVLDDRRVRRQCLQQFHLAQRPLSRLGIEGVEHRHLLQRNSVEEEKAR